MKPNDAPAEIELQSLVDVYDQPFAIVDRDFRVVAINRAFQETYGVDRAAVAGSFCYRFVPSGNRPCPCARQGGNCPFLRVFAGGAAQSVTHTYFDAQRREHLVHIRAHPIRTRGGEVYLGELVQHDAVRTLSPTGSERDGPAMVGSSPAFRELLGRILGAARTSAPVLLSGETGTGKELAAAQIHRFSERRSGPFQVLDCTTLSAELFESEVFGHERGAFTGSVGERPGLFELADGGTLFVDEIGEMPLAQQAKLLRVLESGEYRRVGGTRTRRADVRLVCATNRNLRGASWFRQDLYYRIACIALALPSLRERPEDIPLLARELLTRIGRSAGRDYVLEPSALPVLLAYDFPGNVRELRNLLWVAAVNAGQGRIGASHIAAALPGEPPAGASGCRLAGAGACPPGRCHALEAPRGLAVASPLSASEPERLESVLRRHGGNRRAAAQELGVSERTVYRKIRRYGLD